ncbi:MAG: PEP-CTERM sorting domain-containing protein [Duganella sp.]
MRRVRPETLAPLAKLALAVGAVCALAAAGAPAAHAASPATVDFSQGMQDWIAAGAGASATSGIDSTLGNGTPAFHAVGTSNTMQMTSLTNAGFLGDYGGHGLLTFSVDVDVATLQTAGSGTSIQQDFVLELRDYDKPSPMRSYSSVWIKLGAIGDGMPASQHFSATFDPLSNVLPAGWNGYGEYDQDGHMGLPYAQTFRRLLGDVDQIVIGTSVPNYYYFSEQDYDVAIDNIALTVAAPVPEPAPVAMLGLGLGLLAMLARRRRGKDNGSG